MDAQKIRQDFKGPTPSYEPRDETSVRCAQIAVMGEIAAQLAKLNATMDGLSATLHSFSSKCTSGGATLDVSVNP